MGDYTGAIEDFGKAMEISPEKVKTYTGQRIKRGLLKKYTGEFDFNSGKTLEEMRIELKQLEAARVLAAGLNLNMIDKH